MLGLEYIYLTIASEQRKWDAAMAKLDRDLYDINHMRGPMVDRDIDWTAPLPNRPMEEGDL
jgi:hypothetical protein